jgi:hypothetical protein
MNQPKAFISYCSSQEKLARRLKDDLSSAGCDAWQFNLSAKPGSDSWKEILLRIEKSDFFLALLSPDALESRPVQEEISHAHYHSLNSDEGLPNIIPIILADGVIPPAEIVRKVRLSFREENYSADFEALLRCLGMEPSPFATTMDLDVTFTRPREFDAKREATVYAEQLIQNHPEVSSKFNALEEARALKIYGRAALFPTETLLWKFETYKKYGQPHAARILEYEFLVVFGIRWRVSSGYGMQERVVLKITAVLERWFDYVGDDFRLHSDMLRLKFDGFQTLATAPQLAP